MNHSHVTIDELSFTVNGKEFMSPTGILKQLTEQKLGAPGTTINHLRVDNPMALSQCPNLFPTETLEFSNAPGVDLELYQKFKSTAAPLKKVVVKEHFGDAAVYKIPCIANAQSWHIKGSLLLPVLADCKVPMVEFTDTGRTVEDLFSIYQMWKRDEVLHEPPTIFNFYANTHDQKWTVTAEWGIHKKVIIRSD